MANKSKTGSFHLLHDFLNEYYQIMMSNKNQFNGRIIGNYFFLRSLMLHLVTESAELDAGFIV